MAIEISGTITVQDGNGQNHIIDANDMAFDIVSTDEGNMGARSIYEGNSELDDFSVTVCVEEYPTGAHNHHKIDVQNCQVIQVNLEFNYSE
jgi:hypothetical protein